MVSRVVTGNLANDEGMMTRLRGLQGCRKSLVV